MTTVTSAMLQVIGSSFSAMLQRFMGHPPEIPSPEARIHSGSIFYDSAVAVLKIWNLPETYSISVQDTNSMDGLIDVGHILAMTKDFGELYVGDPIMYRHHIQIILHQIVFIGEDKKGWFAITKGTNHFFPDIWAVRAEDVISRMVAIIYG